MQLFFNLLALLWPFYQFSEFPLDLPFRLYALDLLSLLCFVSIFFRPSHHPLQKPLLIFLGSLFLSLLIAPVINPSLGLESWIISSLYLVRLVFYASLILSTDKIKPYLHLSFFFVPLSGLFQYFLLPDLRFLASIGYDDHYYRLTFPFLDPGFTAAVLVFIIFQSLQHISTKSYQLLLGLSLFALALTFSRSGYLSFIVALIFFILRAHGFRKHAKTLFFAAVFLIAIVITSPKPFGEGVNLTRTYSIFSRLENNQYGLNLFLAHPFTGIGFNTLRFLSSTDPISRSTSGISNSFIFIVTTAGIIGLICFIYFLKKVFSLSQNNPYFQAGLIGLLVNSLTNNTFFYAPILILFFLNLASFKGSTSTS
jgi:hypothetical protein